MPTVKQLREAAKGMNPRLRRAYLEQQEAAANRKVVKPEKVVAKPPVTLNKALVPEKAAQTLRPDPRETRGGLTAMQRPDPV